ncbi:terminase small subunit [Klebsiella pneumoniae RYC492]|nr:terminase small subunit [Klebsiella pneumoniae RYC492]
MLLSYLGKSERSPGKSVARTIRYVSIRYRISIAYISARSSERAFFRLIKMAKPDWGELQRRFLSDHAATGVSPKDWCEAQGLNYATARRYIKKPTAQTAQKPAQKKLRTAQKEKCAEELVDDDGLTDQQRLFVAEYLKDHNATQAAIRAGYSKKTAEQIGYQLLQKTSVAQAIAQQQKASIVRTLGSADEVLEQMWRLATFDANQLSQYRRGSCRYCWGFGHQYQWRDAVEFEEKRLRLRPYQLA